MARHLKRVADIGLTAISIEGALISPDQVAAVAATTPDQKAAADYDCPKGTNLRDEITRYFRIGQAHWQIYAKLPAPNAVQTGDFVKNLLEGAFGFEALRGPNVHQRDGHTYRISLEGKGGRVPVVVGTPLSDGDAFTKALPQLGDDYGGTIPRRSPSVLLQDWLNANSDFLWGLAFAGDRVRLMRDNVSFTRPAYIEADLGAIFRDEMFADFTAIWLLIHATRFGGEKASPGDCALERWREAGLMAGTAARERLGQNVEEALLALGQGFLDANSDLRTKLDDGRVGAQGWFEQLLRVVYRLIFLAVAEDRDLLHGPNASPVSRELYAAAYGFSHMRERSARRSAHDHHHDAWEGAKIVFRGLQHSENLLGLPALGGLFAQGRTPDLDDAKLPNRAFLRAVFHLSWLIEDGRRVRINWRDMATEELGSVYEGLLELVPTREDNGRRFSFAGGAEARGNARKTSGSYYTPDSLVQALLDSALDPVLAQAEAEGGVEAILRLSVIDPACGSGHFLLGAARRMADRVALLRDSEAPDYPAAMRDVASRCIHGVDRNSMAVELAKVALWIETVEPGKPLTFLDSNIRCGDSLIGVFEIDMLSKGIPDEAYKPLTGDDKEVARAYGRFNRQQRDGKGATGLLSELRPPESLSRADRSLHELPEDDLRQVEAKSRGFAEMRASHDWLRLKSASDLYVSAYLYMAAYFVPKASEASTFDDLPLTEHVWRAAGGREVAPHLIEGARKTSEAVRAFHWHIEFPRIFDTRDPNECGFDVVIGNPPWERIKLQEQEFFAARSPEIAGARNKAEREKLIKKLEQSKPGSPDGQLWADFQFAKRTAEATGEFVRSSGRYALTGKGDINTYALFAELFSKLSKSTGRAGVLVPTGIATDSTTSEFFGDLVKRQRLVSLHSFYEIRGWFKGTDDRKSFCILTVGPTKGEAEFCFDIRQLEELENEERRFTLSAEQIAHINPNTRTSPVFRSRADARLTAQLYARAPVLIADQTSNEIGEQNHWKFTYQTKMFDMADASHLFLTKKQAEIESLNFVDGAWLRESEDDHRRYMPLYEAKMIHHFDHRWATYAGADVEDEDGARDCQLVEKQNPSFEVEPRYWVPEYEVSLRAARVPNSLKRGVRDGDANRILKSLVEWLSGYHAAEGGRLRESNLASIFGSGHAWRAILGEPPDRFLLSPKVLVTGRDMQRETPLNPADIEFLLQGPSDPIALGTALIDRKQPRWLMGWRDIALRSVERTVIASVFPRVGVGHTIRVMYLDVAPGLAATFIAGLTSLVVDYVGRQVVGGTHLTVETLKQFPILPPSAFYDNLAFVAPRVLELTYTSHSMRAWAEDLGHAGPPFVWDEDRRALLRAELDAFFALKYDLSRDELRYVLDPADGKGSNYPSETFRVLKANEARRFGEFRTGRLVLEAYDRLAGTRVVASPIELRPTRPLEVSLPDRAWARVAEPQPGDAGAVLAALLKAMDGPKPIRDVRLTAAFVLEPRLLTPLLSGAQALEWRRRVGPEADPLAGNVTAFATRNNAAWGAAVRNHRGNGRLIEDLQGGTWAPGSGLDAIDTTGWPAGRADFVWAALGSIDFGPTVNSLPDEIQQWINNAAAA
ncbi:Eco57I restriction-modification methylase domain-containing protein [Bradyrhizobium elkanii]|uniref:Eco57I restriction-modification methylase domain-containing protein n=1 Tax=Bradyrhizobium elkanii TaxID=29448 RepID=UPI0035111673